MSAFTVLPAASSPFHSLPPGSAVQLPAVTGSSASSSPFSTGGGAHPGSSDTSWSADSPLGSLVSPAPSTSPFASYFKSASQHPLHGMPMTSLAATSTSANSPPDSPTFAQLYLHSMAVQAYLSMLPGANGNAINELFPHMNIGGLPNYTQNTPSVPQPPPTTEAVVKKKERLTKIFGTDSLDGSVPVGVHLLKLVDKPAKTRLQKTGAALTPAPTPFRRRRSNRKSTGADTATEDDEKENSNETPRRKYERRVPKSAKAALASVVATTTPDSAHSYGLRNRRKTRSYHDYDQL